MSEKVGLPPSVPDSDTSPEWAHTAVDSNEDYDQSGELDPTDTRFADSLADPQNSAESARQALQAVSHSRDSGAQGENPPLSTIDQSAHDLVHFSNGSSSNIGDDAAYTSPGAPHSASNSPSKSGHAILMASRKQNSACDACRSRKVRCNRNPGELKCNHCKAKNIECTTLYVQWATSAAKRPTKRARTSLVTEEEKEASKPPDMADAAISVQDRLLNYLFQRDSEYETPSDSIYYYSTMPFATPPSNGNYTGRLIIPSSYFASPKPAATTNAELALLNRQRRDDFVNDLVETYFSVVHARMPLLSPQTFKKRYYERTSDVGGPPSDVLLAIVIAWGAKFSENPLIAADRSESASELQKAYAQAQAALSKGETEKAAQITGAKGGVDQPILTVPAELRSHGRNRLADDLVWRAQDIMDRLKVSRVATLENIQACLMTEPLLHHPSILMNGNLNICGPPSHSKHHSPLFYTNGHWYVIAIKHLLDLGINQKERVMAIKDPAVRGEIMFAWWLACFSDAASSMFFQRRCFISSQDYNSNPPAGNNASKEEATNPLSSPDSYMEFYGSLHDLVIVQRRLVTINWDPKGPIDGVRIGEVEEIVEQLKQWKIDHLEKVGVPLPHWPPHWDYIAAVSACTSDINYHAAWIVLWRALDELGIYGSDRSNATSPIHQDRLKRNEVSDSDRWPADAPSASRVQSLLATVQEEALNGALRIAGLTEILRSNHYLRLDPCNSLASLEVAAHMLVRFQRSEADIMIAGFRQYGLSYEDCFEKADILERLAAAYNQRARVDPSFTPGSALGLAMERDSADHDQNGIPGLAIAAAALSNAAASADDFHFNAASATADNDGQKNGFRSQQFHSGHDDHASSAGGADPTSSAYHHLRDIDGRTHQHYSDADTLANSHFS